jgi:hypothetical protein
VGGDPFTISQFNFEPNSIEIGDSKLHASIGGEVSCPGGYFLVHVEVFQIQCVFGRDVILLFKVLNLEGAFQCSKSLMRWDFLQVLGSSVEEGRLSLVTGFSHGTSCSFLWGFES